MGRYELDLVGLDPGPPGALVVVEVRWRGGREFGLPEETVDHRKRTRVRAGAYGLLGSRDAAGRLAAAPAAAALRPRGAGTGRPDAPLPGGVLTAFGAAPPTVLHSAGLAALRANHRPRDRRGAHTWTVPTGTVPASHDGSRPPATRSAEEPTEQEEPHRADRFDAAAARGRDAFRPSDTPLEPQDAPVYLRGAQRDPHHRPRPDRAAAGGRPRLRARDRRPRRARAVHRHEEAGPGADRGRGCPRQTCPSSTSAGSAAC